MVATAKRLTVNLSVEVAEGLQAIADQHNETLAQAIARCVGTQRFLDHEIAYGATVLLADAAGHTRIVKL